MRTLLFAISPLERSYALTTVRSIMHPHVRAQILVDIAKKVDQGETALALLQEAKAAVQIPSSPKPLFDEPCSMLIAIAKEQTRWNEAPGQVRDTLQVALSKLALSPTHEKNLINFLEFTQLIDRELAQAALLRARVTVQSMVITDIASQMNKLFALFAVLQAEILCKEELSTLSEILQIISSFFVSNQISWFTRLAKAFARVNHPFAQHYLDQASSLVFSDDCHFPDALYQVAKTAGTNNSVEAVPLFQILYATIIHKNILESQGVHFKHDLNWYLHEVVCRVARFGITLTKGAEVISNPLWRDEAFLDIMVVEKRIDRQQAKRTALSIQDPSLRAQALLELAKD